MIKGQKEYGLESISLNILNFSVQIFRVHNPVMHDMIDLLINNYSTQNFSDVHNNNRCELQILKFENYFYQQHVMFAYI